MKSRSVVTSVTDAFVKPRLHYVPPKLADLTLARECLEFVDSTGYLLDPWQAFETEQTLLVDAESALKTWLMLEFGYLVARQNGKGGILTARSLIDLFYLPCLDHYGRTKPRLIVYTAHQFKTATEAFERLKEVIDGSDMLRKQMKKDRSGGIRNSANDKGFDLANGNRLRYLARSTGGSGRGFSIDTLLVDESQELPLAAWDALKYTQRAMPNPQRIITGTVPAPADNSEVWTSVRDRGRKQQSMTMGWSEYSPDPDDPETKEAMTAPVEFGYEVDPNLKYALATNPAFGIRISPRQIQDDAEGKAESYKREVLCWWPDDDKATKILANWSGLHDSASTCLDPAVLAVEVSEDRQYAGIVAAGARSDGLSHLEVVEYDSGTDWIIDRLIQLQYRWSPQVVLIDVGGPAGTLIADLEESNVPFYAPTVREYGQYCGLMYDTVKQERLRWLNHPMLTRAVNAAKWRKLGQGKAWDRMVDVDISLLNAASMALGGLLTGAVPEEKTTKKVKQVSNVMYGFA